MNMAEPISVDASRQMAARREAASPRGIFAVD